MNFNDKGTFRTAMEKAAANVSRQISSDEIESRFDYLKEYPLMLVIRAIKRAYDNRDPDDMYLKTMIVSGPEIKAAADELAEEQKEAGKKCPICEGRKWIVENVVVKAKTRDGNEKEVEKAVAHPCECLYKGAVEAMKKKRTHEDRKYDKFRETVIKSYEAYKRR